MRQTSIILVALFALTLETGCMKNEKALSLTIDLDAEARNVILSDLRNAAESSQNNLDTLRRMKSRDVLTESDLETAPPIESSLYRKITCNWEGPIEGLLKSIAEQTDYSFEVVGNPPPQPIIVRADYKDELTYKVIESVGWQAGDSVIVKREDEKQVLKIIYRAAGI